jgi:hypothetical protein
MKTKFERFFEKVQTGEGCWEWKGSIAPNGYGQFFRSNGSRQAHRISWEYEHGAIPEDLHVCHTCDNRRCVRPSHLFLGTRSDNMKDMVSKNRHNTSAGCRAMLLVRKVYNGVDNHESKLTNEQAMIAKACPKMRGAATRLAEAFGVSITVISDIRAKKRWTHLPQVNAADIQRAEEFLKTLGKWEE